ncbi:MAG TPA: uracil-DNA glycosylase [Chitinispirillaceae bacterium]|nr:uracil-DNA glycosylase [Chitinispirillaceae bacterium]
MVSYLYPEINSEWRSILAKEFEKPYYSQIFKQIAHEELSWPVYPPKNLIFNAFNKTSFSKVSVVIIGQDPYHGPGQAHGLCFSVPEGIRKPPSLVNIFKEIHADLGLAVPTHGNLEKWTAQGVFLLNATLTVRENKAGSHQKFGWETFTNQVIQLLSEKKSGLIFLLWGNFAQAKSVFIDQSRHHILTAAHPSPFSAHNGFFGCRHFSKTNDLLVKMGKKAIDWSI